MGREIADGRLVPGLAQNGPVAVEAFEYFQLFEGGDDTFNRGVEMELAALDELRGGN